MAMSMLTRKGLLIAAYGLLILMGVPLAYLGLRGVFSAVADVILPMAYLAVILFLVRYQMRAFPSEQQFFTFRIGVRLRYLIESLLCVDGRCCLHHRG